MLKLTILAIVIGLVASVPLPGEMESTVSLESALLVPEFENRTNTSILAESMIHIENFVRDENKEINEKLEIENIEKIDDLVNKEMDKLEEDISMEETELEEQKTKIYDEVTATEVIGERQVGIELNATNVMDLIDDQMNMTETRLMAEAKNMTVVTKLESEYLPLLERNKLVVASMNETDRAEILSEEIELIKMNETFVSLEQKRIGMEEDIEMKKVLSEKLMKTIKTDEEKFQKLFDFTQKADKLIEELSVKVKTDEEKEVKEINEIEYGSEESNEESEEKSVEESELEEEDKMVVEKVEERIEDEEEVREEKIRRSYAIIKEAPKMETPKEAEYGRVEEAPKMETPKEAEYGRVEEAPKMETPKEAEYGRVEEAPKMEMPKKSEYAQVEEAPKMEMPKEAEYGQVEEVPKMEMPVTNEIKSEKYRRSYGAILKNMEELKEELMELEAPKMETPKEAEYGRVEEAPKMEMPKKSEYAQVEEAPKMEMPKEAEYGQVEEVPKMEMPKEAEYGKQREVREILDKITSDYQTKNEDISDFISTKYCKNSENTESFQYFKSHPTDPSKYIECNPWAEGTIKNCPVGRIWDQFHEICSTPEVYKVGQNLTEQFHQSELLEKSYSQLNCNNSEFTCVNGGRCMPVEESFKCECTKEFTGEFCEYKVVENSFFSMILTDKFNLTEFKQELLEKAPSTITTEEMENMKRVLTNSTHEEIMSYLSEANNKTEPRFDIVMNTMIEGILEDIYPDAYYMSIFNASSHRLIDVVRTIPSLISYSRYSADRYSEVFVKYQEALDKVVENFNATWAGVDQDAAEYVRITKKVLNETESMSDIFPSTKRTSEDYTVEKLKEAFEKSKEEVVMFTLKMQGARRALISEMVKRPELVDMRLSQLKTDENVRYLIETFDNIAQNSAEIVNELFTYGFWYVTDAFAGVLDMDF